MVQVIHRAYARTPGVDVACNEAASPYTRNSPSYASASACSVQHHHNVVWSAFASSRARATTFPTHQHICSISVRATMRMLIIRAMETIVSNDETVSSIDAAIAVEISQPQQH